VAWRDGLYGIRIRGSLSERFASAYDAMQFESEHGNTVLFRRVGRRLSAVGRSRPGTGLRFGLLEVEPFPVVPAALLP